MRSLSEYMSDVRQSIEEYRETMLDIDLEIIFESFQCKMLQEIRDQLKSIIDKRKAEQAEIDKQHYEHSWQKPTVPAPPYDFKEMFFWNEIQWSTIKDDQVKEWKKGDHEGMKLVKRICSNRSNSIPGMIILKSSDDSEYKYAAAIVKGSWDIRFYSLVGRFHKMNGSLKPKEAEAAVDCDFWTIEATDSQLSHHIKNARREAQAGSINMGDPKEYAKIAQANRERYRKLAEKKKLEKNADDGIYDKIMDYVQKVMDVCEKFSKDPIKYASYEYSVQTLLNYIGDRQRYDTRAAKYYGADGLMYLFNVYLSKKLSMAKGDSFSHERREYDDAIKKINEIFKKIDAKIVEMNIE